MPNVFCLTDIDTEASLHPLESDNSQIVIHDHEFDIDAFSVMKKNYHLYAMDKAIDIPIGDYIAYRLFCYNGKFHDSYHHRLLYMVKHRIERVPMNIGATVIKRLPDGIIHENHIITGEMVLTEGLLDADVTQLSDQEIIDMVPFDDLYHPHKKTKPFFYQTECMTDLYNKSKPKSDFFTLYDPLYIVCDKIRDNESKVEPTPIDVLEGFCARNIDEVYLSSIK